MKDRYYIFFREIPKEFKKNEKIIVGAIEFSNIQSFIFGSVNVFSEKGQIKSRSEYVKRSTEAIFTRLRSEIKCRYKLRLLSVSSGKLMFAVSSRFGTKKLESLLKEIQRNIYAGTEGGLQPFYGFCEACVALYEKNSDKKDAIAELRIRVNANKYNCKNLLNFPMEEYACGEFRYESVSENRNGETVVKDKSFAALKMDLDNLGDFFARICELDVRRYVGEALTKLLDEAVKATKNVFPIFVGGDDIFVLLENENACVTAYELYSNIAKRIDGSKELVLYRDVFGISAGLSILRRDLGGVPLLYYSELVEQELDKAKSVKGKNAISFSSVVLTWQQLSVLKKVMEKHFAQIVSGLDENQKLVILSRARELSKRILWFNRYSKEKIVTREEERVLESI